MRLGGQDALRGRREHGGGLTQVAERRLCLRHEEQKVVVTVGDEWRSHLPVAVLESQTDKVSAGLLLCYLGYMNCTVGSKAISA